MGSDHTSGAAPVGRAISATAAAPPGSITRPPAEVSSTVAAEAAGPGLRGRTRADAPVDRTSRLPLVPCRTAARSRARLIGGAKRPPSRCASAGGRRARRALRGGRPRARAGRRPGARRDARPAPGQRPRLHHLRAPRPDPSGCSRAGPTRSGTSGALRHHRRREGRATRSRSRRTAPRPTTRARASPTVDFGDSPRGRPAPPRLHRQRDGGARCRRGEFVDPYGGVVDLAQRRAAHAGDARRTPSPTTRCG